jgi:methionyl-tRNA formyltransferase
MKIIFFGTPKEVVPILETLNKHFDVVAAITTPDQKSGRKQILTSSPIKDFAQEKNIQIITPQQFNNETIEQLNNLKPDLFVVAAYGKIIPNDILAIPKHGTINIHPSLLPHYRGPTPLQTALLNGDTKTGITFMQMDKEMDHGPILHQIPFSLETTDTFGWLMQNTFSQAAQILPHIIEEYTSGKLKPQQQDHTKATYTKKIEKQDGYIDLSMVEKLNPLEIENWKLEIAQKIRAYYPWPSVWTKISLRNKDIVIKFLPKTQFQVEGKNPMELKDFLNGYPEMKETIEKLFDKIKS